MQVVTIRDGKGVRWMLIDSVGSMIGEMESIVSRLSAFMLPNSFFPRLLGLDTRFVLTVWATPLGCWVGLLGWVTLVGWNCLDTWL